MSSRAMTMQDTREAYDLDLTLDDPQLGSVDLSRFEHLSELDRRRVIIRVLCGLVAMNEELAPEPVPDPTVTLPTRRLPLLGLEFDGAEKLRSTLTAPLSPPLPFLGEERPF